MKISVVIPVYNAEKYLIKAVESALQLDEVYEVILIEDQSPDNALQICFELAQKYDRVKLFQHPDRGNHGAGASRNLELKKPPATSLLFWMPMIIICLTVLMLKRTFQRCEDRRGFNAIGTEYLTEKGKEEFQSKFKEITLSTVNYPAEGEEVFKGLLSLTAKTFGTSFHLNSLTVRRASLELQHLLFNQELKVHQDSDFIIKLAYHCHLKTGNITEAVAMRGIHDDNRITKIVKYSPQYNQRQFLLWKSLNEWAISNQIPPEFRNRIYLLYKSFDLSLQKGLTKYCNILGEALKNPAILKTQYRFTYYNR